MYVGAEALLQESVMEAKSTYESILKNSFADSNTQQ